MRAACARESGSDTMGACSPPSSSPVIPNASTPACRCSSPPRRRGRRRARCSGSARCGRLTDPDLAARATLVVDAEREPFARTLDELRAVAAELPNCRLWACSAAVQATGPIAGLRGRDVDAGVPARGRRRAAGVRVKRALAAARRWLLAGCGGPAGDLFEVKRSGADRAANLTLVVSDDGFVTCNGAKKDAAAGPAAARPPADPRHVRPGRAEPGAARRPGRRAVLQGADGRRARSRSRTPRARSRSRSPSSPSTPRTSPSRSAASREPDPALTGHRG